MIDTLRVLQVGPLPPPVGGMATVIGNLTAELIKHHKVRVLNTVKTTRVDRSLLQGVSAQLYLLARLAWICLSWRPDIVHIHTCSWGTFWRNSVDVFLAKLLGRRVVLHIHGAEFHKFLASLTPPRAWIVRRVFALASTVIVLGTQWRTIIAPWCRLGSVQVISNGVPVHEHERDSSKVSSALPIILCLANYERRKGLADAISAMARMSYPARLVIFGFESELGLCSALQAHAASLGVAERVQLHGPIIGEAKDEALLGASLFCLPSYNEGLPMSMLEAMAAGLAVVVTSVGAIPETIITGVDGIIVPPGDIAALADAFDALLGDSQRRTTMAAAGRARVIRDYRITLVAADVIAVWRRTVDGRR